MQKRMPAEQDAHVMSLLLRLTGGALSELQAECLYNEIAARIVRVPAEYQIALGMQVLDDTNKTLSPLQAEQFMTCVLYCVCHTDEKGRAGYETVTEHTVLHWHGMFRPFFEQRHEALDRLTDALRAAGTPPTEPT